MTTKEHKAKSLIVWDKGSKFEIPGKDFLLINSENELRKIRWQEIDVVYILAELGSGWRIRTEFYGFAVAKKLRLDNKLRCPIVFCSFLSKLQLYNFPESTILRRPGHYFLRLPEEKPQFERYLGIDEDMLEDINGDLFDKQEFIQNRIHDIKDILVEKASNDRIDVLDILKVELIPVKEVFCKSISAKKWDNVENELIDKVKSVLDKDGFQPYNLFCAFNSEDITRFFPKDEHVTSPEWPHRRWQVLFIDDKENIRNQVKALFAERNIACISAKNADEAFDKLKEDAENDNLISVVISDYRLYENGDSESDTWQELQGPQILKHIHYHPDFKKHYAYAILTAKRNALKRHISKPEKFHIHWFNKSDVLADGNHGFNLFFSRIIEIGSEAFFRKFSTPQTNVWIEGIEKRVFPNLTYFYRLHLESFDYHESENEINRIANSNIEYLISEKKLKDSFNFQGALILKSSHSNERELITNFRKNILIPRRIFYVLACDLNYSIIDIIGFFGKNEGQITSIFNTSLGISLTDLDNAKNPNIIFYPGLLNEETQFIKSFKNEEVKIESKQRDYNLLYEFFDDMSYEFNLNSIKSLVEKFEKNLSVTLSEIEKCVNELVFQTGKNPAYKEKFKNKMGRFFKHPDCYSMLSDTLKKQIGLLQPNNL